MKRILFSLFMILALVLSVAASASAQNGPTRSLPAYVNELKLPNAEENLDGGQPSTLKMDRNLVGSVGPQDVVVTLKEDSVMKKVVDNPAANQRLQLRLVKAQQNTFLREARALAKDLKVVGAVQRVANAVLVTVDGKYLKDLAANSNVLSIKPMLVYQLDLATSVPWVGGTEAHNLGYTGKGVKIGIIDSGIDYTHALLGGSGVVADYTNNDPTVIEPGTFPTAKVVGGYDFVGSTWPNGPLAPDPDPLDRPTSAGHGTHVASIAAGLTGMAPEADLYALKVCSSVANSCSSFAMLQAMDWATDPNGDGLTNDHLDVINMSIGSSWGQPWDDDTSKAAELTSMAGVLVVASAGNSGDKPYASGTPGASPSTLSTAATNNPGGFVQVIKVVDPAGKPDMGAIFQSWSAPLTSVVEAPVQYGDGAGGQKLGCSLGANPNSTAPGTEPFPAGSLAGKIVLVDRGVCNFSIKVYNVQRGGGLVGIIGLVTTEAPFDGALGAGGPFTIPGFMISKADADFIRNGTYKVLNLDPANVQGMGATIASFSSRGPGQFPFQFVNPDGTPGEGMTNFIKPEISAPGVITAAGAGKGTGLSTLQGTSMASPMVAGSAAVLKQARPELSGRELKAVLVNYAAPEVLSNAPIFGGTIVPVTRQGGGEVRVVPSLMAPAAAWETQTLQPSLSFGFVEGSAPTTMVQIRNVTVKNYTDQPITFQPKITMLYADDMDTQALAVQFPNLDPGGVIIVPANGMRQFAVRLVIDATKLRQWGMNSGPLGGSGAALAKFEYDGYLFLDDINSTGDDANMLHLAWHVLPRKGGKVVPESTTVTLSGSAYGLPAGSTLLANYGAGDSYIDIFSLLGESPDLPEGAWGKESPIVDLKYFGTQTYPVPAGVCSGVDSFVMAFSVTTWERAAHADFPAEFDIYLDTNQDGSADYVVFNYDLGALTGVGLTGQNVTAVYNMSTGKTSIFFYTGHTTNSSNYQLLVCGEQIGMNATNFFQPMTVDVYAFDDYYTGDLTDFIEGMVAAPLGERYGGLITEYGYGDLAPIPASATLTVVDFGAAGTNPGELGLLLVTTGTRGAVASGAPLQNEAIKISVVQP